MKKAIIGLLMGVLLVGLIGVSFAEVTFVEEAAASEKGNCYLGIFREGAPSRIKKIKDLEKQTGKNFPMIMWYVDWSAPFPKDLCDKVAKHKSTPHIVWEPWLFSDRGKIKLDNIIKGEWDDYIKQWAGGAASWKKPIFVRWGHEFNIEGYPWGIVNNGKDAKKYIKAYRHVHDIFKKEGADNVIWVWCPMRESWPQEPWNDMNLAYPGDEYVDWIGIDGYNWGTTQSWSVWQTFKELFRNVSRDLSRRHPEKPIMIAEFASAEKGGDKAKWISEIVDELKKMPYIKAILWFDEKKETDWRTDSSEKTLAAFKEMMNDPYFSSTDKGIKDTTTTSAAISKKRIVANFASSAPTIDGDLSEWADSIPLAIDQLSQAQEGASLWKNPSNLSGKIYVKWDKDNFYFAANVEDNVPMVNKNKKKNIWNGDAIEMVFGLDKKSNPNRNVFSGTDFQIGFGTGDGDKVKPTIWNWTINKAPADKKIAVKKTDRPAGYSLEAMIPWPSLCDFIPSTGNIIGFDCALDDADEKDRIIQMVWNGDYMFYKDPGVWGELEFGK